MRMLTDTSDTLNLGPFARDWSTHAVAYLGGIEIEFGECTAKRVAVHAEFLGGFALVALVVREHLQDVALFELPNSFRIGNSRTVHLDNQTIQFALQGLTPRLSSCDAS